MSVKPLFSNKEIYQVYFTKLEGFDIHTCKSCRANISQNLKKGFINCVNHVKTVHEEDWKQEMEAALAAEKDGGCMLQYMKRKVSQKAQTYHDWCEWVIMDDQPFSFVDNKYARKNTKLEPICRNTLMKYLDLLSIEVQEIIKTIIPSNFGLIFDGYLYRIN